MTKNDSEFLSAVFGPFNPFVLISFNTRNNDLSTPSTRTCDESFLFRVLSLPCGSTIKIAGSVCLSVACLFVRM